MRLGAGGKRGDLLVPHVDPLDLSLAADRIREAVEAIADDSINSLDAGARHRLGKLICNRRHVRLPLSRWTCACGGPPIPSARPFLPKLFLDCACRRAAPDPIGTERGTHDRPSLA